MSTGSWYVFAAIADEVHLVLWLTLLPFHNMNCGMLPCSQISAWISKSSSSTYS